MSQSQRICRKLIELLALAVLLAPSIWAVAQDGIRPKLASVVPANGATNVDPTTPVRFTFSEPMKPQQAVLWVAAPDIINSNLVQYAWSADGLELTASLPGGWPSTRRVSWFFQPSVPAIPNVFPGIQSFEDLAGNQLGAAGGTFTTSAGGPPPPVLTTNSCGIVFTNPVQTIFSLTISAGYAQTNSSPPIPNPLQGASRPFQFLAGLIPGVGSASSVTLQIPGGTAMPLPNRLGFFSVSEEFESMTALRVKFPAGTYRFVVTGASGGMPGQADLTVPDQALPIVHVTNFGDLQSAKSSEPVMIIWEPLGGTASDALSVVIRPQNNLALAKWASPDPGCPDALDGTSTSVTIPAGSLTEGTGYNVELRYFKAAPTDRPNSSSTSIVSLSTTTTMRLITCSTGRAIRDRGGDVVNCDANVNTGPTNTIEFVAPFVIDGDQLTLTLSPTEASASYQLYELVLPSTFPTGNTPEEIRRPIAGGLVEIPVGTPVVANGTRVEFAVKLDKTSVARLFTARETGGRRGGR